MCLVLLMEMLTTTCKRTSTFGRNAYSIHNPGQLMPRFYNVYSLGKVMCVGVETGIENKVLFATQLKRRSK